LARKNQAKHIFCNRLQKLFFSICIFDTICYVYFQNITTQKLWRRAMSKEYEIKFKGGVETFNNAKVKFLMFFVTGGKEISLAEAKRFGFVRQKIADSIFDTDVQDKYLTEISVVKIFITEIGGFGTQKLLQSFYLALGCGLERRTVTITPKNTSAKAIGYEFRADARFLKSSEAMALLDPTSIGYSMLKRGYHPPPLDVLRQLITIDRHAAPQAVRQAQHGAQRFIRMAKQQKES
jgi:hypothetical protein